MCIVEEASNDLLDAFFVGFVKFGTCVDWVSSLIFLSILDRIWVLWAMLWLCSAGCGCSYRSNFLAM
jgi:hypothetical protein